MAFWSGERLKANPQVISDFDPKRIDCNSYTLRMGESYYRTADEAGVHRNRTSLAPNEQFQIPTGQFAYLLTKETVDVPKDTMAFISMRTGFKNKGLINVSGFNVDPGYKGKLIFAVFNAGSLPVYISEGEGVFKIWFTSWEKESGEEFLFGKPGIQEISNDLVRGMSNEILSLQALSKKLGDLETSMSLKVGEQKATHG